MSDAPETARSSAFTVTRDGDRVTWHATEARLTAALDALVWWLADALPGGAQRDRGDVLFASTDEAELAMAAAHALARAARDGDPFARLGELDALTLPDAPEARRAAVRDALRDAVPDALRDDAPDTVREAESSDPGRPPTASEATADAAGFETIGAPTQPPTVAPVGAPHEDGDHDVTDGTSDTGGFAGSGGHASAEPAATPTPDPGLPRADAPGTWDLQLVDPGPNPARTLALLARIEGARAPATDADPTVARALPAHRVRAVYFAVAPATGAALRACRSEATP